MSKLEIIIDHKAWNKIPTLEAKLRKAARVTQEFLPKKYHFKSQATLLLTNDRNIQRLNRVFRGKPAPTNVLSFPQYDPVDLPKIGKDGGGIEVGDISIAYQYVVAEANENHKILLNHVVHLMIHGLLHLFGYDHMTDRDATKMERLEKRIMAELKLPDPYKVLPAPTVRKPPQQRKTKR